MLAWWNREYHRWEVPGQSQLDGVRSADLRCRVASDPKVLLCLCFTNWHIGVMILFRYWDNVEQKWVTANDPGTSVHPLCSGEHSPSLHSIGCWRKSRHLRVAWQVSEVHMAAGGVTRADVLGHTAVRTVLQPLLHKWHSALNLLMDLAMRYSGRGDAGP